MTAQPLATRVAVVTGGASGIGRAVVVALTENGATVVSLDRDRAGGRDPDPDCAGGRAELELTCDVTDTDQVDRAVVAVADRFGGIDIVVNNAGIGSQGTIEADDDAVWQQVLDVNVLGIVRVTRASMPHLRRSDAAAVVNVGSIAGWSGLPERAAYSASKGAVHALTQAMAADGVADGVRVNAVAPGIITSTGTKQYPPALVQSAIRKVPLKRAGTIEECAASIVFLASPGAQYITGATLRMDGAASLWGDTFPLPD